MAFSFTDRKLIATVFIQGGYVLDFNDSTFAEFFRSEFGIDIDQPLYLKNGRSKGNRLRAFFELADALTALKVLAALWGYLQFTRFAVHVDAKHAAHIQALIGLAVAAPASTPAPSGPIATSPTMVSNGIVQSEAVATSRTTSLFASYAHHKSKYDTDVLEVVQRLRGDHIDARSDHFDVWTKEGWPAWMARQLKESRFVLVFASEMYQRRADGLEKPDVGLGVIWEYGHIRSILYDDGRINERFLPVGFGPEARAFVPRDLQAYSYFDLSSDDDYRKLLSVRSCPRAWCMKRPAS